MGEIENVNDQKAVIESIKKIKIIDIKKEKLSGVNIENIILRMIEFLIITSTKNQKKNIKKTSLRKYDRSERDSLSNSSLSSSDSQTNKKQKKKKYKKTSMRSKDRKKRRSVSSSSENE